MSHAIAKKSNVKAAIGGEPESDRFNQAFIDKVIPVLEKQGYRGCRHCTFHREKRGVKTSCSRHMKR
ncbi:MAG: hypothetical protein ACLTDX_06260 [[Clostridium] innocuum]